MKDEDKQNDREWLHQNNLILKANTKILAIGMKWITKRFLSNLNYENCGKIINGHGFPQ